MNYASASWEIFGDDRLYRTPDLINDNVELSWKTALWFWRNAVGWVQDVKNGKFGASINAINGPLECSVGAPGLASARTRVQYYRKIMTILGETNVDVSGCNSEII